MGWFRDRSKSSKGRCLSQFRVTAPSNVKPGGEFLVDAGNRIVRVRYPCDARPGQWLLFAIPDVPQDSENVWRVESSDPPAYIIKIPKGTRPGEKFQVTAGWQQLLVTCPEAARAGMIVKIVPPPPPPRSPMVLDAKLTPSAGDATIRAQKPNRKKTTVSFEVRVPEGATPGSPFAVKVEGLQVLIRCPKHVGSGKLVRFSLPLKLFRKKRIEIQTTPLARMKLLAYGIGSFFSANLTRCMCRSNQGRIQEEQDTVSTSISTEADGSNTWEFESESIH